MRARARTHTHTHTHTQVREYRQHWWKCNGPCQHKPPYFGIVKRAMNRAPSSRDPWWSQHKASCDGTYEKIKEPEGYGKKKSKRPSSEKKTDKSMNIRDMFMKNEKKGGKDVSIKAGTKVGEGSGKLFEGGGYRLDSKDKTSSSVANDGLSLREKMLLAAEKRQQEAKQHGTSSQAGGKRSRDRISHPSSHHSQAESFNKGKRKSPSEYADLHPSAKRAKVTSNTTSVIVIDSDSPQIASRTLSNFTKEDKSSLIDLSKGEPGPSSALLITDDVSDKEVVALDDTVAGDGDSSEASDVVEVEGEDVSVAAAASPGDEFRTCPVCGMTNIPKAIINAHTVFCLDAEEESQLVDDETL